MSIQTWPKELPGPERTSWQKAPQDSRQRRAPTAGAPNYRSKYSRVADEINLSVVLSRNEVSIFDRFFQEDCVNGVALFWMPDPTTDGWHLLDHEGAPLLTGAGVPLLMAQTWLCSWGEELPTETLISKSKFRKSFNIVVVP